MSCDFNQPDLKKNNKMSYKLRLFASILNLWIVFLQISIALPASDYLKNG